MMQTMNLLTRLQEQADRVRASINEANDELTDADLEVKRKRLKTLDATIDKVYGNLETHLEDGDN